MKSIWSGDLLGRETGRDMMGLESLDLRLLVSFHSCLMFHTLALLAVGL